jgi:hypothetical protein
MNTHRDLGPAAGRSIDSPAGLESHLIADSVENAASDSLSRHPGWHCSSVKCAVRLEISQVAEFAPQNANGWRFRASCGGVLEKGSNIRRLRLRCGNALRRRIGLGLFSNKQGEHLNPLKSLNPKRQIQVVNRQERAI